jgi:hypothetical protein
MQRLPASDLHHFAVFSLARDLRLREATFDTIAKHEKLER